jgi:hypothetical protein
MLLTTPILNFIALNKNLTGSICQAMVVPPVTSRALNPSAGDAIAITLEADEVSD